MDEHEEADVLSVVARGDASEQLELVEASFDPVALSVERFVVGDRAHAISLGRVRGSHAGVCNHRPDGGGVIGFVGENGLGAVVPDQGGSETAMLSTSTRFARGPARLRYPLFVDMVACIAPGFLDSGSSAIRRPLESMNGQEQEVDIFGDPRRQPVALLRLLDQTANACERR